MTAVPLYFPDRGRPVCAVVDEVVTVVIERNAASGGWEAEVVLVKAAHVKLGQRLLTSGHQDVVIKAFVGCNADSDAVINMGKDIVPIVFSISHWALCLLRGHWLVPAVFSTVSLVLRSGP